MKKYYKKEYQIKKSSTNQKNIRSIGIIFTILGLSILIYFSFPILIWNYIFTSIFPSFTAPIPPSFILTLETIQAMEEEQAAKASSTKKTVKETSNNWILSYPFKKNSASSVKSYTISIPALTISHATVSTVDFNLSEHLVQYWNTPLPPLRGNTVIFGHSSLPSLFEKNNYKTIFANAYTLEQGDTIFVHLNNETYPYKVIKLFTTEPDDLTVLNQEISGAYLTIITCTPPGTTWKRLIIKAKLSEN